MKKKKMIGYIICLAGLGMIAWNAYTYFSDKSFERITASSGPLLFLFGAVVIRQSRKR